MCRFRTPNASEAIILERTGIRGDAFAEKAGAFWSGRAVTVLDADSVRDSTLLDLYSLMRIVGRTTACAPSRAICRSGH